MKKRLIAYPLLILFLLVFYRYGKTIWHPIALKVMGQKTVDEAVDIYEQSTYNNLYQKFKNAGIQYPPKRLALIAYKDEKNMELWASNGDEKYKIITSYPILATSGKLGPKLVEGDRQVPEGLYKIEGLNPNSAFHLSMKINYPNDFDLIQAKKDGRKNPGTNIFIHGSNASIGCLAMGNPTIENLFTLVYLTGKSNTKVLITPSNPIKNKLVAQEGQPTWTAELYKNIEQEYYKITQNQ